jgi:small subunit ribosomal protein S17
MAEMKQADETGAGDATPLTSGDSGARRARKQRIGIVTGDRAEKTVTVTVERRKAHPLYGKQVRWSKRYHAHDEENQYRVGDQVRIQETRPLSKTKRWRVVELIERPE